MSASRASDVIVIGSHAGGLAAAALLAQAGHSVQHVDHDGHLGGYVDGGLVLPTGPELLPDLSDAPVFQRLRERLELDAPLAQSLRPARTPLQLLAPGVRMALPGDEADLRRELTRELGASAAPGALTFLAAARGGARESDALLSDEALELPATGIAGKWRSKRRLKQAPAERSAPPAPPLLGAAAAGLHRLSSYLWTDAPTPLHTQRAQGQLFGPLRRVRAPDLRHDGYAGLLRARLEALGGRLAEGAVVEGLQLERGRVTGVRLLDDPSPLEARYVISALDTAAFKRLIPLEGRKKRYDSTLDSLRVRELLFSTNLVMAPEGWPPGLGEAALWIEDPAGPIEEHNFLLLQRFEARDPAGKLRPQVVLQISCFIDAKHREVGAPWLSALQDRLIDHLEAGPLPFLRRHLKLVSSPYLIPAASARGARLSPHPLFETSLPSPWGVEALPPRTPYANLFQAGREVIPGLGLEGELMAGAQAARIVAEALARDAKREARRRS